MWNPGTTGLLPSCSVQVVLLGTGCARHDAAAPSSGDRPPSLTVTPAHPRQGNTDMLRKPRESNPALPGSPRQVLW